MKKIITLLLGMLVLTLGSLSVLAMESENMASYYFISCISLSFMYEKFIIKAFFLGQQSTLTFSSILPPIV